MSEPVIVDTNILFSALLKSSSRFTQQLVAARYEFFVCESTLVELFKHKERIVSSSRLADEEVVRLCHILLCRLTLVKEELVPESVRRKAFEICTDVDATDTPHVALALYLGGKLWTRDDRLKRGLQRKGFDHFFELQE